MSKVRTADYGGAEGLYIPPHATDIVVSEMHSCSVLSRIANNKYTVESLGLACAPVAYYTILNNIEVGDFAGGDINGETIEPDSPFSTGEIRLCQTVKIQKKFSNEEALMMCKNWEKVQEGYENAVGQMLRDVTERYGFRMLVASASPLSQGTSAGTISRNINLGDSANPVVISRSGSTKIVDVLQMMEQSLQESGITCNSNGLKIVVSPAVYTRIRSEQGSFASGCCLKDHPLITGMKHPMLGMDVYSSLHMPRYTRPDGRVVEYILMVDSGNIVAPSKLDYLKWQELLNDTYLIGHYRFDVAALSGKSIAVAAIVLEN